MDYNLDAQGVVCTQKKYSFPFVFSKSSVKPLINHYLLIFTSISIQVVPNMIGTSHQHNKAALAEHSRDMNSWWSQTTAPLYVVAPNTSQTEGSARCLPMKQRPYEADYSRGVRLGGELISKTAAYSHTSLDGPHV